RRLVHLASAYARRGEPRVRADGGAGRHPERDRLRVIVERAEHPSWTSNAYLVADGDGGHGVLVDSNGVEGRLLAEIESRGITITHVLVTHQHGDHVVDLAGLAGRF